MNMKANRKFVDGEEAVSAVIGVILMVAITVAIAATVYVYVSGMIGTGPATNPTVSMIQSGDYISITSVENGPVTGADATVNGINQTSGVTEGTWTLAYTVGNALNVDGGDSISVTDLTGQIGQKYTVQLLYGGDVIGTCVYTITT